jgi:hypothetical protein
VALRLCEYDLDSGAGVWTIHPPGNYDDIMKEQGVIWEHNQCPNLSFTSGHYHLSSLQNITNYQRDSNPRNCLPHLHWVKHPHLPLPLLPLRHPDPFRQRHNSYRRPYPARPEYLAHLISRTFPPSAAAAAHYCSTPRTRLGFALHMIADRPSANSNRSSGTTIVSRGIGGRRRHQRRWRR